MVVLQLIWCSEGVFCGCTRHLIRLGWNFTNRMAVKSYDILLLQCRYLTTTITNPNDNLSVNMILPLLHKKCGILQYNPTVYHDNDSSDARHLNPQKQQQNLYNVRKMGDGKHSSV